MRHLKTFHVCSHNNLFLFSCRFMQKWLEMSWSMPGQLENIIIVRIIRLRLSQIGSYIFFQYCEIAIDYTSMSCNQLFQYPLILSHPSVAKCIGSCTLITTKSCLCSCTAYGACCFTHYTRVCSTNSSKYFYHWRRGIFINLLCCFEETCLACLVARYFFKKREKKH